VAHVSTSAAVLRAANRIKSGTRLVGMTIGVWREARDGNFAAAVAAAAPPAAGPLPAALGLDPLRGKAGNKAAAGGARGTGSPYWRPGALALPPATAILASWSVTPGMVAIVAAAVAAVAAVTTGAVTPWGSAHAQDSGAVKTVLNDDCIAAAIAASP
jgi:hypothetical protein